MSFDISKTVALVGDEWSAVKSRCACEFPAGRRNWREIKP